MTAHMEDSVSENQRNDMQVENEHDEPPPHVTTFNNIQIWIYFAFTSSLSYQKQYVCQHVGLYQSYCTTLLIHCAIHVCFPQPFLIYTRLFDQVRWKRQFSLCVQMMRVTSCINLMNLS